MMIRVLLIHAGIIPQYRVPIYGYLSKYLKRYGFDLIVASDGIQHDNPFKITFRNVEGRLSVSRIVSLVVRHRVYVIIDYMELRHRYLFPTYIIMKGFLRRKMIYWGQGRDLLHVNSKIKNFAYAIEQFLSDAIILYADHLKKYVPRRFHEKTYIANNTLYIRYRGLPSESTKERIFSKYGIKTKKNIICIGRMQKRKLVDHLFEAFLQMNRPDIGLILVGPDPDKILDNIEGENVYKLGPIYGEKIYELLSSADVYCLPGAVGLSIVDAFYCGLPFVTEEGDESAEIMYLKDGVNGFIVPKGDIIQMSQKILNLLNNEDMRKRFSSAARQEILINGNMDKFCFGFLKALIHVTNKVVKASPIPNNGFPSDGPHAYPTFRKSRFKL
jgi:glycosyltransferase involved in cell wall biosynthesis